MAGTVLKGQCNLVSIMVPHRDIFERKIFTEEKKNNIYSLKFEINAAFSIFLIDISFTSFRTLIIYLDAIFLILKFFKEIFLDLMLQAVNILRRL